MELRHLRYFLAVAQEGHVTRAAARLGMQQPPLSQQIRALERELGVALFVRGPRGMSLTAAGEAFLPGAQVVLDQAARAAAQARLAAEGRHGRLAVGITTSAMLHPLLPRLLGAFGRGHPGVTLEVREANASDLTEAVARGGLDVAFLRAVVSRPPGLAFVELLREPLLVALPGEEDAPGPALALGALRGERFILVRRPAAPGLYAAVLDACRLAGFEPAVAAEVERMPSALGLVAAGLGVTLVPASLAAMRLRGVRYRPLDAPGLEAPLTVAHRAGEDRPLATRMLGMAKEEGLPS